MKLSKHEKIAAVSTVLCVAIAIAVSVVTLVCVDEPSRLPYFICLFFVILAAVLCVADIIYCHRIRVKSDSGNGDFAVALKLKRGPKSKEEIVNSSKTKTK